MHDNDAAGRELLADVTTMVELLNALDRASTPEQETAIRDALQIEGARQRARSMERTRERLRDRILCDAMLGTPGGEDR